MCKEDDCAIILMRVDEMTSVIKFQTMIVEETRVRGRPRKTWPEMVKSYYRALDLTKEMNIDRDV